MEVGDLSLAQGERRCCCKDSDPPNPGSTQCRVPTDTPKKRPPGAVPYEAVQYNIRRRRWAGRSGVLRFSVCNHNKSCRSTQQKKCGTGNKIEYAQVFRTWVSKAGLEHRTAKCRAMRGRGFARACGRSRSRLRQAASHLSSHRKRTDPPFGGPVLLVREAGLEPARPEWTLEPEGHQVVLMPVNPVLFRPQKIQCFQALARPKPRFFDDAVFSFLF